MARQIRPGYVHAVLRQPPQADNPGAQTTDGSGPVRAPGQPNVLERRVRVMAHAEAVTQTPALSTQQEATTGGSGGPKVSQEEAEVQKSNSLKFNETDPGSYPAGEEQGSRDEDLQRDSARSPRVQHPLRPLSDLARLRPSSRLALPRWRSN